MAISYQELCASIGLHAAQQSSDTYRISRSAHDKAGIIDTLQGAHGSIQHETSSCNFEPTALHT